MQDVIEEIVKIEGDADKIILAAREEATARLAQADRENALMLQEAKERERERVAAGTTKIEADQAAQIKKAVEAAQMKFNRQAETAPVEKLAELVADRIKQTIFDQ